MFTPTQYMSKTVPMFQKVSHLAAEHYIITLQWWVCPCLQASSRTEKC